MIVKAADSEEYEEVHEVVGKAFRNPQLEHRVVNVTTSEDPNFKKGDLRVVKVDGKVVSMMMLIRRPLRIGTAIVNGAIIAPVATHPANQGKGYCSAVMRDAVQYMKTQGFDLTILWGNPWLYPHYGYSPAMMSTELVIKPKQNSMGKGRYESRPLEEADLEQITHLYHSNTATRTCAEIRSPTMWEWKPSGSEVELKVFLDKMGEVIGYTSLGTDFGRPCAHEVGVLNDEACEAVFNFLLENAERRGLKELYCITHPDNPFARFAFWRGGEIRIRSGDGAGMVRVLNLASLLKRMGKEFERRLKYSELHDVECSLKISTDEESAVLNISHGQVSVSTDNAKADYQLDIPLASLNPMVTGYKAIRELVKNPRVDVKWERQDLRLLEILFPAGRPSGGFFPLVWE